MASEATRCLEMEFRCKQGQESPRCACCGFRSVSPTARVRSQAQVPCAAGTAAILRDEEASCMVGARGSICYPGTFMRKTLGEIKGQVIRGWTPS